MKKITKILLAENFIVNTILMMLWVRIENWFSYPFYLMLINAGIIISICLTISYREEKAIKTKPLGG